ncbi:MAG: UDP-N-acetylglucosamine--N-acetylmuramyl-(pentapeptide) pyrophosphoryl-undecaprenol N-acetylglucosamine transferase [Actinobacteria bacterium]|nr:UDP-N-acetylglucosamine--N-acetylmuramyl-(pentapeptide) pyrophosphoryl-undecaprenol N-acetylglucosamine transferase [Actinomycetota bacterium]
MIRILGAGGGTKGHAFPLKEIIKAIKKRRSDIQIFIAGVKDFEKEIAKELGASFIKLEIEGLPRSLSLKAIKSSLFALRESLKLLKKVRNEKIDATIITGGYVCFPAGLISVILNIPIYIHEQNAVFGLSNRVFVGKARKVFLSFEIDEDIVKRQSQKFILSGNPVREEALSSFTKAEASKLLDLDPSKPSILIFGGSQGAKTINEATIRLVQWMKKEGKIDEIQFILLTGKKNFESVSEMIKETLGEMKSSYGIRVYPEWKEMGVLYSAADAVVSRAGASTVAEIMANGLPALLIPYPYATANHQMKNAESLEKKGAALVVSDEILKTLSEEEIYLMIKRLVTDSDMKKRAEELKEEFQKALPQDIIADIILSDLKEMEKEG